MYPEAEAEDRSKRLGDQVCVAKRMQQERRKSSMLGRSKDLYANRGY